MKTRKGLLGQLRLRTKLLLAIGIGFVITLVVGLSSIQAIRSLSATTQRTIEQDLLGISNIMEAQVQLTLMGRDLRWMAMSSNAKDRNSAKKSVAAAQLQVSRQMEEGRKRVFREDGRSALREFDAVFPLYAASVNHVIALLDNGNVASEVEANRFLAGAEYDRLILTVDRALDAIVKSKQDGAQQAAVQAQLLAERSQWLAMVLLVAGLLLSVVFGLVVVASIRRPLDDLRRSVESLAGGKLDIVVPYTGLGTEIGAMADAIGVLQQGALAAQEQDWIKRSLVAIDQAVFAAASYQEFGERLTSCLAPLMGLFYGALYLPDANGVWRAGGYGADAQVHPLHFAWGEGLVGQVAKDRRTQTLTLPEQHVSTTLGLGQLQTRHVLVCAVLDQDELLGVLEFGAQDALDGKQRALVDVLLPSVAARLKILSGSVEMRTLLAQIQNQSAALPAEPNTQGTLA